MSYSADAPSHEQVDDLQGAAVLDFGTNWCGHCRAAAPIIAAALAAHPNVHHIKVEDGKGRPLGRRYQVKLWPTLIFLENGEERARLVRPTDPALVNEALEKVIPR